MDWKLTAKRLKELRTSRKLSHEKLAELLSEKYTKITANSLKKYEVADENHSDKEKVKGMRIEFLYNLADFYEVSTDYILGKTNIKNPNVTIKEISEKTGLSESTIESLVKLVEISEGREIYQPFIDYMVENLDISTCRLELQKIRDIQNNCKEYLLNPSKIEDMSDEEVVLEEIKIKDEYDNFNEFRTSIMNHISNLLYKVRDESVALLNGRFALLNEKSRKMNITDKEIIQIKTEIEKICQTLEQKKKWFCYMLAIKNERKELRDNGDDNTEKE